MTEAHRDTRSSPRIPIRDKVFIRIGDNDGFEPVELDDLSQTGGYFRSSYEFSVGKKVRVYVPSDNSKDKSVELTFLVVRKERIGEGFGYGCTLENKSDP